MLNFSRFTLSRQHHFCRRFSSSSTLKTKQNTTSIRLYRILLRMVNGLNDSLPLQSPLDPRDYGQASLLRNSQKSFNSPIIQLYTAFCVWNDHLDENIMMTWYENVTAGDYIDFDESRAEYPSSLFASRDECKSAIRQAFRRAVPSSDTENDDTALVLSMQRLAMQAIQDVQQQQYLQSLSSVSIDADNRVRVVATSRCVCVVCLMVALVKLVSYAFVISRYILYHRCIGSSWSLGNSKDDSGIKYRFAYRIRVENLPSHSDAVQLLGRKWCIQDTTASGEPVGEAQHVDAPTTGAGAFEMNRRGVW